MYNDLSGVYTNGTVIIRRNDEWREATAVDTSVVNLIHRIEVLEELMHTTHSDLNQVMTDLRRTRDDLHHIQIDRTLIAETNGSRLYIEGPGVSNLPTDLEDVTLRELLEIISL